MPGLLRVCPANPRYFTDDSGKALYLSGSHTWNNLVDMGADYPPRPLDYTAWLDFLQRYGHNFFRLWAWELPRTACPFYAYRKRAEPFPWERTGPGLDVVGLPKFDLTRFHQPYFDRMRQRIQAAAARGMYVSVMLFEGWCSQSVPDMTPHPFYHANNVNGIAYGQDAKTIYTLANSRILAVQEGYVRKVVETVSDLDNVTYEIANEAGGHSEKWQHHMVRFVRECEATLPKHHLVGMTYAYQGGTHAALVESGADWISPGADVAKAYWDDPPAADGRQIIVSDTDHLGGSWTGHRAWAWKSFTRGMHTLFMDRFEPPYSVSDKPYEKADEIRRAMGDSRRLAERMDLTAAAPRPDLASTGFCLANPGREYAVYLPARGEPKGGGGAKPPSSAKAVASEKAAGEPPAGAEASAAAPVTVDLSAARGALHVEWLDPLTSRTTAAGTVEGGAARTFRSPFAEDAVLFLATGRLEPSR